MRTYLEQLSRQVDDVSDGLVGHSIPWLQPLENEDRSLVVRLVCVDDGEEGHDGVPRIAAELFRVEMLDHRDLLQCLCPLEHNRVKDGYIAGIKVMVVRQGGRVVNDLMDEAVSGIALQPGGIKGICGGVKASRDVPGVGETLSLRQTKT